MVVGRILIVVEKVYSEVFLVSVCVSGLSAYVSVYVYGEKVLSM